MCNNSVIEFAKCLMPSDVNGKRVVEVGSLDVNGSLRPIIQNLNPKEYLGIDIEMGPNVDEVCEATEILDRYGENAFDVVVTTEMLEHVRPWKEVVHNLKRAVSPGGILLVTTRSFGVPYHGYPYDFWRYELEDMTRIFDDMEIEKLDPDPTLPGVMMIARVPESGYSEKDLSDIALYSIVTRKRTRDISALDLLVGKLRLKTGQLLRKLHLRR